MAKILMYDQTNLTTTLTNAGLSEDQINDIIAAGGITYSNNNGIFSTNKTPVPGPSTLYLDNNRTYYILQKGSDDNPNFVLKNSSGVELANIIGKVPPRNEESIRKKNY